MSSSSLPRIDPRFEGLTLAGKGSMGAVYKAWDRVTASPVAIKVPTPLMRDRFLREATVLAAMDHPNIVRYRGHGSGRGGCPWLAMEWLDGEDLEARLARGALGVSDTLRMAVPVARAIAWAHERRFVHRDLKPTNLFLQDGEVDRPKVLDFGLARPPRMSEELTATGMYMGTFEYMPPEQRIDAKRADARSDVFSLGALLFHALTGSPPPVRAHGRGHDAPRLSSFRSGVPTGLDALVARMLANDPADRPANGGEVLAGVADLLVEASDWDAPTVATPSEIRTLAETAELPVAGAGAVEAFGPSGTVIMSSRPTRRSAG